MHFSYEDPVRLGNRTIGVNLRKSRDVFHRKVLLSGNTLYNVEKNIILDLQRGVSNANFTTGS